MSELGNKQARFTKCLALLILEMIKRGYEPRLGPDGVKHMKGSLHYDALAADINLFKDGVWLKNTDDHKQFGEFWESLDPDAFWGGPGPKEDGLRNDGNHYSFTYQGKK